MVLAKTWVSTRSWSVSDKIWIYWSYVWHLEFVASERGGNTSIVGMEGRSVGHPTWPVNWIWCVSRHLLIVERSKIFATSRFLSFFPIHQANSYISTIWQLLCLMDKSVSKVIKKSGSTPMGSWSSRKTAMLFASDWTKIGTWTVWPMEVPVPIYDNTNSCFVFVNFSHNNNMYDNDITSSQWRSFWPQRQVSQSRLVIKFKILQNRDLA